MAVFSAFAFSRPETGRKFSMLTYTSSLVRSSLYNAGLNRSAYYKAMQEDNKGLINAQLEELKQAPSSERDAFMGAMTMKKAGLGGNPITRLNLFLEGHKLLEDAISQNPFNAEFRFLRVMIQENAPGFLGYNDDVNKDVQYINKLFKTLSNDLQLTIAQYAKRSKVLRINFP
jgi:hypothetical protein